MVQPGTSAAAILLLVASVVYHLLKTGEPYREEGAEEYERMRRERELKHLARRAQKLGYTLAPTPTTLPESPPGGGS